MKCPTCESPEPRLHPATQNEGEVSVICEDPYHLPATMDRKIDFDTSHDEGKEVKSQASSLAFAQWGLDREVPGWTSIDWRKPVIHLGPGVKHIPNTIEYDWPEWDFDKLGFDSAKWLKEGEEYDDGMTAFPHMDSSVGGVIATHVLEHLRDPRPLLREVSRILAPGCPFNILVPHGQSLMFLQDLDHKTAFVTETWKTLLENPYYEKEHQGFNFAIGANFLFGLKESNLALVTQLIKQ